MTYPAIPAFAICWRESKKSSLEAYAHQDIPFEKLVEELQPERSLSHNPIFQVLFALQNAPMQATELSRASPGTSCPFITGTSMFDMSWFAIEVPEGLLLRAEYNTDLFDDATIARRSQHFQTLLESIASHPERRISEIALVDRCAKVKQVLVEFNATAADYPTDRLPASNSSKLKLNARPTPWPSYSSRSG